MDAKEAAACFDGPFSRALDIVVFGTRVGLAWIEWEYGGREAVACRVLDGEEVVVESRLPVPEGCALHVVKACFRADGQMEVYATAFERGREHLFCAMTAGESELSPVMSERSIGDFAPAAGLNEVDGWLAAQRWGTAGPVIELWRRNGDAWRQLQLPDSHARFASNPTLAATGTGALVLVWAEHAHKSASIHGVLLAADESCVELAPLEFERHYATHPVVVADRDGTAHLACCLERPVASECGAVGWHSRIVTSVLDVGRQRWHTNGESCIDYAMNPWMAGYAGRRRWPSVVAKSDGGAWVLFEEKIDPASMAPGPGRLALREIGDTTERILLSGHSEYHIAPQLLSDGRLAIASLTQEARYERTPPRYRLHAVPPGAALKMRPVGLASNAALPRLSVRPTPTRKRPRYGEYQLFFGDPHLHSCLSADLEGEQEELYLFARDEAKLDFVAFTENDFVGFTHPLPPAAGERSRRNAEFFNTPGVLTAFVGWEYTLHQTPWNKDARNSHRSVLFPGRNGPFHSWLEPETRTAPALAKRLCGQRVLLHHHHPWGYDITHDTVERNIEVCSGWWNCMRSSEFVERLHGLLNSGLRLGFIGGSDNHERNPGFGGALTGVWAESNTREAIFDAFWNRRVFATTGLRPVLRFSASGVFMGGVGVTDEAPVLAAHVRAEQDVSRIEIIRNGRVVHSASFHGAEAELEWRDEDCPGGLSWYYAHVIFAGGLPDVDWESPLPLPWNIKPAQGIDAWTSPVWIRKPRKQ